MAHIIVVYESYKSPISFRLVSRPIFVTESPNGGGVLTPFYNKHSKTAFERVLGYP